MFPGMGYPLVPGYETVGRVVRAASDTGVQAGQRVFVPGANCFTGVKSLFGGAASRLVVTEQKVVPVGLELETALTIAHAIAAQAPLAVVATRLNVLKAVEHGPVVAMHEFIDTQQRLSNSDDAKEGVLSFVEKRDARFTGR